MDRMSLGEEISMKYVENVLVHLITVWNEKISSLREEVRQTMSREILQREEKLVDQRGSAGSVDLTSDVDGMKEVMSMLEFCNVSSQPKAIGMLGD